MKSVYSLIKPYRLTFLIHGWLPRRSLRRLRHFFAGIFIISGTITIITLYTDNISPLPWFGFTLIMFGLWLDQFILYAFNNSRYFYGLDSITGSHGRVSAGFQYISASSLISDPTDCIASFFTSRFGKDTAQRLGLAAEDIQTFLSSPRTIITDHSLEFDANIAIDLVVVAEALFEKDAALRQWLAAHRINRDVWLTAAALTNKIHTDAMRQERWWSRDNLSRRKSIGAELAYGHHYFIASVSRPFTLNSMVTESNPLFDTYVDTIAAALAKEKASNILLIGTESGGVIDVLMRLQYQFSSGQQLRSLHHPYLYEIDMDVFFSRYNTPASFTDNFLRLCDEATLAGNIILVFTHFSQSIERAAAIGIDLATLIDDYLISQSLHIIAVDAPSAYQRYLRRHSDIIRHFTEVVIDVSDLATLRHIVTSYIIHKEASHNTLCTIAAIEAIVIDADRYLTTNDMPERAITLADAIMTHAHRHALPIITADDVHVFVKNITNAPIGPVSEEEAALLVHLEDYLSTHIAGQPQALTAIARTMRRSRADIERHNKPIGSFLFLGPTGVGKTETAKALARAFFSSEDSLIRYDMSEYSQSDGVGRLIGTTSSVGSLTAALSSNPYAVILLDEFEKAHRGVHDLFLQILDEGFYTTGDGEKMNTRNTIIIATSNAASDLIARTFQTRQTSPHLTQEIINSLTSQGIFRPELINRFDNTVIFEPLHHDAKRQVVIKFLNELIDRVTAQGYTISYDESIIALVMEQGFDPAYGARPLQRFIQNLLEDHIATMILEKSIQAGIPFVLSATLFTSDNIAQASQN